MTFGQTLKQLISISGVKAARMPKAPGIPLHQRAVRQPFSVQLYDGREYPLPAERDASNLYERYACCKSDG